MACFCHKLFARQYSNITEMEIETLKRTWDEAPQLFQTTPSIPSIENPAAERRVTTPPCNTDSLSRKRLRVSGPLSNNTVKTTLSLATTTSATTTTTTNLEKTYSYENAASILKGIRPDIQQKGSVNVRIYLAIEQSDYFQRICFFALARLHKKHTSVDAIAKEIEDALPNSQDVRKKVYRFLYIGSKWEALVEQFATIVPEPSQELTGLLCLLGSGSTWERSTVEDRHLALANLYKNTDIHKRTLELTPFVNEILAQILLEHSFVDETRTLGSHSSIVSTMSGSKSSMNPAQSIFSGSGAVRSATEAGHAWKAPSLEAASKSVPQNIRSNDAGMLLVLLSFLSASEKVPQNLIYRGASLRKRWDQHGKVQDADAIGIGLAPELVDAFSSVQRLDESFHELELACAVSKNSDQTYQIEKSVAARICESLPPEHILFWRFQALVIAYRAIPWKHIEPIISNVRLFLPHLQHTLTAYQHDVKSLSANIRADIAFTLIEATRFPGMAWKRFAASQTEMTASGIEDCYIQSYITQSQSLLGRITGNMDQALSSLDNFGQVKPTNTTVERMHWATGQVIIQRSLNCIQIEDLSGAKQLLEEWNPSNQSPPPIEEVILFRKSLILGRILRFQGEFKESLIHLKRVWNRATQQHELCFDEDLRDLTCELADTLRELDDSVSAERYLRMEIARQNQNGTSGRSSLELCLAEVLFAQERFGEAERLCLDIQSRSGLLKIEKLRLFITLAKLRHIYLDDEGASSHWAQAMVAISKFPNESAATRIIVMSVCEILSRQRVSRSDNELLDQSLNTLVCLGKLVKPGGIRCWIAGLRYWVEYLDSKNSPIRSHI